ncbi:hypothetical protein AB0I54_20525 [Streptomyces sp. NPDC050625]
MANPAHAAAPETAVPMSVLVLVLTHLTHLTHLAQLTHGTPR